VGRKHILDADGGRRNGNGGGPRGPVLDSQREAKGVQRPQDQSQGGATLALLGRDDPLAAHPDALGEGFLVEAEGAASFADGEAEVGGGSESHVCLLMSAIEDILGMSPSDDKRNVIEL
jgi:hypothetical protein